MTDAVLSIRLAALEARLAALEAAQTQPEPPTHDLADADVLTVDRLSQLWRMKPAKVRELLRTGRLPGRKLGPREWIIPVAALREWARQNPLDAEVVSRYHAPHDVRPGQGAPEAARPYAVEVRRPGQGARGDRQEVGDGEADRWPPGRARDDDAGGAS